MSSRVWVGFLPWEFVGDLKIPSPQNVACCSLWQTASTLNRIVGMTQPTELFDKVHVTPTEKLSLFLLSVLKSAID